MIHPIDAPLPEASMPKGLEVRPFEAAHNQPIWEALDEAFKDHWGHVESTEEDYQRFLSSPNRQPELWQVAWDGDEVAGMILNAFFEEEDKAYNRKRGWTDPICTRRPWRRRGLARALLVESIAMFKEMGFDDTALGVDTENPSGALKLYESVGYKTDKTWISYRKPMK
jgi:ribosomal protein S18 acetylase RimI-like enzyme